MTPILVLILLVLVTAVLSALIASLHFRIRRLELAAEESLQASAQPSVAAAPAVSAPMAPSLPMPPPVPESDPEPPQVTPSSGGFSRNPVETSPAEQARLDLQRSVEQARLNKQQTGQISLPAEPPQSKAPESTVRRAEAVNDAVSGHFQVPCPECNTPIPVSATEGNSRYVCPQCGQPIRFEE